MLTRPRIIMGLDPGFSGGVAFLDAATRDVVVYKMPKKVKILKSGKKRSLIDEDAFRDLVERHQPAEVWLEDVNVHGREKGSGKAQDGVVGAFSFGRGFGTVIGVLGALRVPRHYTSPQEWKGALSLTSDKAEAIRRAQRLFPRQKDLLTKDGPAEAAMIALFGLLRGK